MDLQQVLLEPVRELVAHELKQHNANPIVRLGTVAADYTSGLPAVLMDGDETASGKKYAHLASYTPAANERVLLLKAGSTWVIAGKIIS